MESCNFLGQKVLTLFSRPIKPVAATEVALGRITGVNIVINGDVDGIRTRVVREESGRRGAERGKDDQYDCELHS